MADQIDRIEDSNCPLCANRVATFVERFTQIDIFYDCPVCGRYCVNKSFVVPWTDDQKHFLSAYCRQNRRDGWIKITPQNVEQFCESIPRYTPLEKIDRMLEILAETTPSLGKPSTFHPAEDFPLVVGTDWAEANFLLRALEERGLVDRSLKTLQDERAVITVDGWARLEDLKNTGRSLNKCFVAMAFASDMNSVWKDVIEPAITDAGYKALRIDQHAHVNRIDDEIIGQIRRSRFMVADFTHQRGGVYFEAGMMLGLGRNVIWMCNQNELDSKISGLHFDVRQFNFLTYTEAGDDIKKRLYERILAIEGEGPLSPVE